MEKTMGRFYVLVGAVVAGGAIAAFGFGKKASPSALAAEASSSTEAGAAAVATADDGRISGEVIEVLDVPRYTYLHLRSRAVGDAWAAVPSASVKTGQQVQISGAMKMANFESNTLKRKFDTIYFGTLATGDGQGDLPSAAPNDNPHGDPQAGASPHGTANPHGAGPAADVPIKKTARAEGPTGHTIAEIFGQKDKLSGQTVRVRATVVKNTAAVFGHTFLHVRDGSGSDKANDLAVTALDSPAVGEAVMLEGKLATNKDLGAGFHYDVLLEDAKVVGQ
jgi:hypothetical protein